MAAIAPNLAPIYGPQQEMISPKNQHDRLYESHLNHARVAQVQTEVEAATGLLPDLAKIVTKYAAQELPPSVIGWHTALEKLYTLGERHIMRMPALPSNILQILEGPLTDAETAVWGFKNSLLDRIIWGGERYLVKDIYSLRLIHKGSLNEYEARLQHYRAQHPNDPNRDLFQFRSFCPEAKAEHGDVSNEEWEWALVSNDILPGSRGSNYGSYSTQRNKLDNTNCDPPTLSIACTSCFDHALATSGERLLQPAGNIMTSASITNVIETTQNARLRVGFFGTDGLCVYLPFVDDENDVRYTPHPPGILASRRF